MKVAIISEQDAVELLKYLITKPFAEAERHVNVIRTAKVIDLPEKKVSEDEAK